MKNYLIFISSIIRIINPIESFLLYHQSPAYYYEILWREKHNIAVIENMLPLDYIIYKIIPETYFKFIILIIDVLVAYWLDDPNYYILSSFLAYDHSSFINLYIILFIRYKNIESYNKIISNLYPYLSVLNTTSFKQIISNFYLYYEVLDRYKSNLHLPSHNIFWFNCLYSVEQYKSLLYNIVTLTFFYLGSMAGDDILLKILLIFAYSPSTIKNYLFLYLLYNGRKRDVKNFFLIYFLFYVLALYITYLFKTTGIGNLNFVNWAQFLFMIFFILERNNFEKET